LRINRPIRKIVRGVIEALFFFLEMIAWGFLVVAPLIVPIGLCFVSEYFANEVFKTYNQLHGFLAAVPLFVIFYGLLIYVLAVTCTRGEMSKPKSKIRQTGLA
jgi:hypothetical protein